MRDPSASSYVGVSQAPLIVGIQVDHVPRERPANPGWLGFGPQEINCKSVAALYSADRATFIRTLHDEAHFYALASIK